MEHETLVAFGDTLKAVKRGNDGFVEATGVRFSGPDERDLEGDYFTSDTDYGPHGGNGMAATLNHRVPMITSSTKANEAEVLKRYAKRTFRNPVSTSIDENGIIARHILDLSDEYEAMIFEMAQEGKLRWSSGAPGHMVDRADDRKITMWHIAEWAYTPTAAEPRLPAISPVKALAGHAELDPAITELSTDESPDSPVDIEDESEEPEAELSQDAPDASTAAADADDDSHTDEDESAIEDRAAALSLEIAILELENS